MIFKHTMQPEQAFKLINHTEILRSYPTTWADLGCGSGLFTNALAAMLKPGSKIIAVDKNIQAFKTSSNINEVIIDKVKADFTSAKINLTNLDGILMANSLHFVQHKPEFIGMTAPYFRRGACFVIVEYDTDTPNPWIPYPLSFRSLQQLFAGFEVVEKINQQPSKYNRANIYSAFIK
jgi:ubiquinone/menaquinone biosynthesis C-methylase UbiE